MRLARFRAVFAARNKEVLRDRAALGWNFAFPFLVIFGFAFLFTGGDDVFQVAVLGDPAADLEFLGIEHVRFVEVDDRDAAIEKLRRHQFDLVLEPGRPVRYWINEESPKGPLVERVLRSTEVPGGLARETVAGRPIRYVDWLAPGLIALNMMFSCLFGVGYVLVQYRKNGVLRRLKATPLSALEFLAAQLASRWVIVLTVSSILFVGAALTVGLPMAGPVALLVLVFATGAACHVALGLLLAARTRSEEFAGGILNLVSWPMMLFSGVWFSLEGTPPWVQRIALAFPLTHVIDGARAVMIDGAGPADVGWRVAVLAASTAAFLVAGAALFRWE